MAYVEGRTIHDADSHVMELPGTINEYIDDKFRDAFVARAKTDEQPGWVESAVAMHDDPGFRAGDEENILLRKNYQALGSFRKEDRPQALDYLGFTSQLVFTTSSLSNYGLEHTGKPGDAELAVAAARASRTRSPVANCPSTSSSNTTSPTPIRSRPTSRWSGARD